MSQDLPHIIILSLLFLLLFAAAQLLYYRFKLSANVTRKIVHTGTGLLTLLFPVLLSNHWQVLFLCALFAVILVVSKKINWLKSIHSIDRFSYGSILYPIAVYSCYLAYEHNGRELLFFYLPVLILAICDPLAAFAGSRFPYGAFYVVKGKKTISGSVTFFVSAFIVSLVLFDFLSSKNILTALPVLFAVASVSAVMEALSTNGLDNITVPVSVLLVLTLSR